MKKDRPKNKSTNSNINSHRERERECGGAGVGFTIQQYSQILACIAPGNGHEHKIVCVFEQCLAVLQ